MSDIQKTVELGASPERVWRALTDHEEFSTWFRVKLDGPFAAGEASTGHMTIPGYEHVRWEAVVERIEAPRLFSFRWHPYAIDSSVDYSGEPMTLVEFRLEPTAGGTRLTVTESGFEALPEQRRPDALRMNERGWEAQMRNIAAHVGG
ncbi:MAG TPA: SRPBCC family protein [Allosphingosinicella sp.]